MTRTGNEERTERITNEVIVDAYTAEEQALGWYYYLERQMGFPFRARCIEGQTRSPLQPGETVRVVGMADESDCMDELFVLVAWRDREFGAPLTQLEPLDVDDDTRQAVEDWHYWNDDRPY